jgi:2-keto-4-pentenoate hydratase/2-oxohepta-3-ene-1,7-dioic acid hydratase in catechol pathway
MRLLSYLDNGQPRYGVAAGDGVIDLSKRLEYPDLQTLIARDGLDVARKAAAGQKPDHALDDLALLSPIPAPEKIWCIGVNYKDRNAEYKDNSDFAEISQPVRPQSVVHRRLRSADREAAGFRTARL